MGRSLLNRLICRSTQWNLLLHGQHWDLEIQAIHHVLPDGGSANSGLRRNKSRRGRPDGVSSSCRPAETPTESLDQK